MPARSAYLHVPFCRHRCGYCNFTVVAGRDELAERYVTAMSLELAGLKVSHEVDTIFLGGGTPTHLTQLQLWMLLKLVQEWFPLAPGGEYSVEANPRDALDVEKLTLLREQGVTRISLGVQSFSPTKLALLERDHDAEVIAQAVRNARARGLQVSLDLIFGTPGETLTSWQDDLRQAIELRTDHLSTYGLTFERGTAFWSRLTHGELQRADEDLERDMYLAAIDTLTSAGFEHYEVSNFAQPGHQCRHNQAYWEGREYYAAGPGAARYLDGRRETNHRSTTTWMARVLQGESPVAESDTLSAEDRARERLVFGLRQLAGVNLASIQAATGVDIESLVGSKLAEFTEQGFFLRTGQHLQLTRPGLLISDAIWPYFLE
jgi:oxygen-independent coproporphyrinogen-3 oxidase